MQLTGITIPALLCLTNINHVSAGTPPNLNARQPIYPNEPILKSLLPREQSTTTLATSPSPAITQFTTTSTTTSKSSSTSSTTTSTLRTTHNHNIAVSPPTTNLTSTNSTNSTTPQFHPSTLKNIPIGDTLTFYFYPQNYSIVQSSFELPCQPLPAGAVGNVGGHGWFSGWHPTGSEEGIARSKFVVTVSSAATVWVYGVNGDTLEADSAAVAAGTSTTKTACELGLVMVVNPLPKNAAGGLTLGKYKDAAVALRGAGGAGGNSDAEKQREMMVARNVSVVPDAIWGGEVSGVSDKEKARWEGGHPEYSLVGNATAVDGLVGVDGSGSGNGTVDDGSGDGGDGDDSATKDVAGFKNGVGRGKKVGRWNAGSGWMGVVVVLGVGVFGLGV